MQSLHGLSRNKLYVDDPHVQSHAALSLLVTKLGEESHKEWLTFRVKYLSQFESLVCHYCGKEGLLIETDDEEHLATVDHVVPLSKGGAEFDPENLVVACLSCNGNKKDKDYDRYTND